MTINISLKELLESGAHFGHQAKRWNPKMQPYLHGVQDGVHVFDLIKTKTALEEALSAIKNAAKDGKVILLVGCKKQVKEKVKEVAEKAGISYVNERWLGGTFSNFDQIKKSIKKLAEMKKKMAEGEYNQFTKKERLLLDREIQRLERFFGGISTLEKLPDMLILIDIKKELSALREAIDQKVETVAIVDSNSDPTLVDWPIPMNDDAVKALSYVLDLIGEAVEEGKPKKSSK